MVSGHGSPLTDRDHGRRPNLAATGLAADTGYPECCIHQIIEQQAQSEPERTALLYAGNRVNYRTLRRRCNQFARYLQKLGVRPESVVGVCMEPCLDTAVTALAILKAGGVSLSLPPSYPEDRRREMIEETQLQCVVTIKKHSGSFNDLGVKTILLDEVSGSLDVEPETEPETGVSPLNAAFIRFTSGSTGRPKGVVNIHRSLTARLVSSPLPDIERNDVCALNTDFGLNFRLLLPLACGATVVILKPDQTRDVFQFASAIQQERITSVYLVSSFLRHLLASSGEILSKLQTLRAVTVGGEPLTPDVIARFARVLPTTRLINVYGSNEMGGTATLRVFTRDEADAKNSIGRAVTNTEVYVLDEQMNPVSIGVPGEIYVSSGHLARGYLNNPAGTSEAFVPNPFGKSHSDRLFRTGDLARYAGTGELEYLGRFDHQVKVRGFRVELQEVEAVLLTAEDLQHAVVTTQDTASGTRLVAYVVPREQATITVTQLKEHLRARLPEYMVPTAFVLMAGLPLTQTGKIDRRSLPPPDGRRPLLDSPYSEPRTELERKLCSIWQTVLMLDRVGIDDRFLDLGGDSLSASRVAAKILEQFGLEVSLAAFFEESTVATLADRIQSIP